MNVTLVMVQTADGKTTMWHEPEIHGWASPDDHSHFERLKSRYPVLAMGRKTYEAVKPELTLTSKLRRIVLTQRPKDFSDDTVPGKLEFTDEQPRDLVTRLEREGVHDMLLAGGSEVNEAFLAARCITDVMLTIEPRFFGTGNSLFSHTHVDIRLKLLSTKRLNDQGTIVLHYLLEYDRPNDKNG